MRLELGESLLRFFTIAYRLKTIAYGQNTAAHFFVLQTCVSVRLELGKSLLHLKSIAYGQNTLVLNTKRRASVCLCVHLCASVITAATLDRSARNFTLSTIVV